MTPTLSWPTPGPSAFFTSRYVASTLDATPIPRGGGAIRGRVIDWRGIGLQGFRIQIHNDAAQADAITSADGQYSVVGLPPGMYEISVPEYRAEPARGIPILAGSITTLDWIETGRSAPTAADPGTPLAEARSAQPTPTSLVVERAPESPARPSPPELAILRSLGFALERAGEAFSRGATVVVALAAILAIVFWFRSRL